MDTVPGVRPSIDAWCAGRDWRWRAVVLALVTWQSTRPLNDPDASHLFRPVSFGAHELGHLLFAAGGEWLGIAGGSLMQLLVPVAAMAALYATSRDWFGVAIAGLWLAGSLADLAPYVADARTQQLDLLSFSPDGGEHDWHYLLSRAGLLRHDVVLARLVRFGAVVVGAASAAGGSYLLWRMARLPGRPATR